MKELFFLTIANHLPRLEYFDRIRYRILALAGIKVMGPCTLWGPFTIRPIGGARNIEIGQGTFINSDVRFGVPNDKVVIGSRVQVGPRVMFETVNHGLVYVEGKGRGTWTKPIVIEDEVWIGGGSIITQGVTIGEGAVVAAGSVVTNNVDPHTVVGGTPAKFIKHTGATDKQ
ncbi:acyltransferase [Thalassotalea euphylliae]|uniref:Acyltransferase n=1 Tax=Thalassotalea euphylliae TaxID=1655234 RepID=A0A3E0U338_9GAMM|nr:acyltransferase [Thalassotalea euphylliae]REL31134.1 acyltransferase [Thalassotalea euphylliae]